MPTAKITENNVKLQVMEYLSHKPIRWWRNNVGAVRYGGRFVKFGENGSSDILGYWKSGDHRGKIIALELKKPGWKESDLRPGQRAFIEEVLAAGGFAGIVASIEDLEQVLAIQ